MAEAAAGTLLPARRSSSPTAAAATRSRQAGTTGNVGPNLNDSSFDQGAVEEQVAQGGGGMPAFEGQLSEEEIQNVAAYVVANEDG